MNRPLIASAALVALLGFVAPQAAFPQEPPPLVPGPVASNFEVVGHDPLLGRGMNAAIAVHRDHVYVGSRTDASAGHVSPGVLVVDVAEPTAPTVVGEIGPPDAGNPGESSRELRVWPAQDLLLVLNLKCDTPTHACTSATVTPTVKFYDVSAANAAAPKLVSTYTPPAAPHEMFLWLDGAGRALLYLSTWKTAAAGADLIVTDVTRAREGVFHEVAQWNGNAQFEPDDRSAHVIRLHSVGLSADGRRAYVAYQGGGVFVLDTSDVAAGVNDPQIRQITAHGDQPTWGDPGAHSAVKIPGRPLLLTTDEVYGNRPGGGFQSKGCPWGWLRILDISEQAAPAVVGEYRTAQNDAAYCQALEGLNPLNTWYTSYSAHNPTVVGDLAFVTWHSGGLHAVSLGDPAQPGQVGVFVPEALPQVTTEDPALSAGLNKVVMWSYPIVRDGLLYVVDVRNGLYILRYTGPGSSAVSRVGFREGNSNVGVGPGRQPPR